LPGRERGAAQPVEPALHLAAVLRARDDLLAGIAALVEIDAARALEVDHLRHELILGRLRDEGAARADLGEHPLVRGNRRGNRLVREDQASLRVDAHRDLAGLLAHRKVVGEPRVAAYSVLLP